MPELTRAYAFDQYFGKERSLADIAGACGTYPAKVRRVLLSGGATLRTRSKAQKNALANGKGHPTRGKQRSPTTKQKISTTLKGRAKHDEEE